MIEKYEITEFASTLPKIRKVKVNGEDTNFVWIRGFKVPKRGVFEQYHDTWEAAHAAIIEDKEEQVALAQRGYRAALQILEAAKAMTPPKK